MSAAIFIHSLYVELISSRLSWRNTGSRGASCTASISFRGLLTRRAWVRWPPGAERGESRQSHRRTAARATATAGRRASRAPRAKRRDPKFRELSGPLCARLAGRKRSACSTVSFACGRASRMRGSFHRTVCCVRPLLCQTATTIFGPRQPFSSGVFPVRSAPSRASRALARRWRWVRRACSCAGAFRR